MVWVLALAPGVSLSGWTAGGVTIANVAVTTVTTNDAKLTGDNISVHHLYNIKRLAYEIQVPPPAAFAPGSTDDPAQRRAFSGGGYAAPAPMPASTDAQVEEIVRRVLMELKK